MLEDLLQESEEIYGHPRTVQEKRDKTLNKYWYKYDHGIASSSGSSSARHWDKETTGNKKVIEQLASAEPGIKIENPAFVELSQRIKVMTDGKNVLERAQNKLKQKKAGLTEQEHPKKRGAQTASKRWKTNWKRVEHCCFKWRNSLQTRIQISVRRFWRRCTCTSLRWTCITRP